MANFDKVYELSERPRRRRADAERSRSVILDTAARLLGERPGAGMEAIAAEAGLTRQTVYAHFSSRDDLMAAVVARIADEAAAAMDAAELDEGPAVESLLRLLGISWRMFERYPVLLHAPAAALDTGHDPLTDRLIRLIRRGQEAHEFDPGLPSSWLAAAVIALGHAAGDEVRSGRMSADEAEKTLRVSVLRLSAAPGWIDRPTGLSSRYGD